MIDDIVIAAAVGVAVALGVYWVVMIVSNLSVYRGE